MVVLQLTSHGKLQVKLQSLKKRLCAVLTTELVFNLRYFHPLEHAFWKPALSVEVCVTIPAALSKLPVCSALLTLKQYFVTRDTDPQSRVCKVKAEEMRDYTITVQAIYGNPITGNCGISGLRVNGDIILECKYILPTNCKTLDMIPFFLITK